MFSSLLFKWKEGRELPQPGTFENIHREARTVSASNYMFDGAKADLAKGLSANFQVAHSYTLGSTTMPPTYHFGGIYVNGKHLLHGMVDTNGMFQGKYHFNMTPQTTLKFQSQFSAPFGNNMQSGGQAMCQTEIDWQGADCSINTKIINPDVTEQGSGIYTLSMLQSLTKGLAVGGEVVGQKMGAREPIDFGYNLAARYATPQWIGCVTLQQLVALQASYFQKISDKVEVGTELQMLLYGPRKDAIATASAKFDYRQATIRTQFDSTGKVGLVYEEKLFPGFSLLLSGEIDHVKGGSRFGFGVNLEN